MLNANRILDRFGDEDFLRELWLRARGQLPEELAGVEKLLESDRPDPAALSKRLHKLRGLIANFLEGGQAVADLRICETLARASNGGLGREPWSDFQRSLASECSALEQWLAQQGYPCS